MGHRAEHHLTVRDTSSHAESSSLGSTAVFLSSGPFREGAEQLGEEDTQWADTQPDWDFRNDGKLGMWGWTKAKSDAIFFLERNLTKMKSCRV